MANKLAARGKSPRTEISRERGAGPTSHTAPVCARLMISPGLLRPALRLASTLQEIKRGLSEWWSGGDRGQMEEEEGRDGAYRR